MVVAIPLDPWITQLVHEQRPVPLAAQIGWVLAQPLWAPAIACGTTLPLLLLPEGRLRSRRWRPMAAAAVAGPVIVVVADSLAPIGLIFAAGVAPALPVMLSHLASLCLPVAVAVARLRYRLWDLDRLISRTVT